MIEFRQGFRSMAAPTRELEKLIVSRQPAMPPQGETPLQDEPPLRGGTDL